MSTLDPRTMRLMWRVLWLAPPLYAAAGFVLRARMATPPGTPPTRLVLATLLLVVVQTIAWVGVDARFASPLVRTLSRWLLAELTAFAGMVLYVVGGPPWLVLAIFAWALTLHVLAVPEDD